MSYPKTYVATATISPEAVEKFLKAFFGEPVKQPKRMETISHPALVKVKSGDGIGFDTGDCIAVTNAKNNVGMLLKANYKESFAPHESLVVAKKGVRSAKELVPGHTYIVYVNDTFAFVKYLGFSMVLVRCQNSCDIMRLEHDLIPPHYELSLSAEK